MGHALFVGLDPWGPLLAAGSIVAGADAPPGRLVFAGIVVHGALSLFWAIVLALILPRLPRTSIIRWGGLAGALIAVLDLRLIGPSFVRIAALPLIPQLLDHIAFGAIVAIVIRARLTVGLDNTNE